MTVDQRLHNRQFRNERDFWLCHFYQPVGMRRQYGAGPLDYGLDCVPAPVPSNASSPGLPAGVLCWLWRWGLNAGGYGIIDGRKAHVESYTLSRGEPAKPGLDILHLCDRPYCLQPGHLVAGTDAQNAQDRVAANNEVGAPSTWADLENRHERLNNAGYYADLTQYTPPEGAQQAFIDVPCLHSYPRGEGSGCFNCGYSPFSNYSRHCFHHDGANRLWPCRCRETYCRCHVAHMVKKDILFLTEADLYGCDRCRHYVVDLEFHYGPRPVGHDFGCQRSESLPVSAGW